MPIGIVVNFAVLQNFKSSNSYHVEGDIESVFLLPQLYNNVYFLNLRSFTNDVRVLK